MEIFTRAIGRMASLCLVFCISIVTLPAQDECRSLTELTFSTWSRVSGTFGAANSRYRFSSVLDGVDAIVTIKEIVLTELVDLDVTSTGHAFALQPQVRLAEQALEGREGYMEFQIEFVVSGTINSYVVDGWTVSAIDVDGDEYRIREGVGFYAPDAYTLENNTDLDVSLVTETGEPDLYIFEVKDTTTFEGISTTATEHMVYLDYTFSNSFVYRTYVFDDGVEGYWSDAPDRLFSINFSPCVIDEFQAAETEVVNPNVGLPVEWLNLGVESGDGYAKINWTTAWELNNRAFMIQRSDDGEYFENVGEIAGTGTADKPNSYEFVDKNVSDGIYYYRIRQVDIDGEFSDSRMLSVKIGNSADIRVSFYPNPVSDKLSIELLNLPENESAFAYLLTQSGQKIELPGVIRAGKDNEFDLSGVANGLYRLIVSNGLETLSSENLLIQH